MIKGYSSDSIRVTTSRTIHKLQFLETCRLHKALISNHMYSGVATSTQVRMCVHMPIIFAHMYASDRVFIEVI